VGGEAHDLTLQAGHAALQGVVLLLQLLDLSAGNTQEAVRDLSMAFARSNRVLAKVYPYFTIMVAEGAAAMTQLRGKGAAAPIRETQRRSNTVAG
jgi:hypothetical protein